MKNIFESIKIGSLIGKNWIGRASKKENSDLDAWTKDCVENQELFNILQEDKEIVSAIERYDQFNSEKAWSAYERRIGGIARKRRLKKFAVAASTILVLSISIIAVYQYLSSKVDTVDETAVAQIEPGEPKAYLESSKGEKWDLQNLNDQHREELKQKVGVSVDGNTIVDTKDADIEAEPEWMTLVTPRGGEYKMVLEDSTEVWLNADSRLVFPNKFVGTKRLVKLEGEAYFSVRKNKQLPFIVELNGMQVRVLGTQFNVSAYNNDVSIKTTLVEGKVSLYQQESAVDDIVLNPGQQGIYNKDETIINVKEVDVSQYISWKDGRFVFTYETLEQITRILERWYDVEFEFQDEALKSVRFSGEFLRYDNLDEIFKIIRKTGTSIDFNNNGKTIKITR
ncbi:FecR family protein [Puteibacter caeruleilacunae]|nr:FecR family protein [Puteibacter caeruleilacunae]